MFSVGSLDYVQITISFMISKLSQLLVDTINSHILHPDQKTNESSGAEELLLPAPQEKVVLLCFDCLVRLGGLCCRCVRGYLRLHLEVDSSKKPIEHLHPIKLNKYTNISWNRMLIMLKLSCFVYGAGCLDYLLIPIRHVITSGSSWERSLSIKFPSTRAQCSLT